MKVVDTIIPEVKLIEPVRHVDERGHFSEVFSRRLWEEAGLPPDFIQDNYSLSRQRGVIRGLHFQIPPYAQTKLLRVLRGSIFDVAVDIRHGSPTFGRFVSAVLSAENWNQILIPKGFAHGFCTLEPETEVLYKVDNYYSRDHDLGLAWNDGEIGITWPVAESDAVLSPRDHRHPMLAQLPPYFATTFGKDSTGVAAREEASARAPLQRPTYQTANPAAESHPS